MGIDVTLYKKDENKVNDGVWFEVCKHNDDWMEWSVKEGIDEFVPKENTGKILLRPTTNVDYLRYISKNTLSKSKMLNNKSPEFIERLNAINQRSISKHILKDWKGFNPVNEKGDPVEFNFSEENAMYLLKNDPGFLVCVMDLAGNPKHFLTEDREILAKNWKSV